MHRDGRLTFAELLERVDRLAAVLGRGRARRPPRAGRAGAVGVGPGPPRPLPPQRPRVPRGHVRRLRRPGGAVQRELPLRRRGAAVPARPTRGPGAIVYHSTFAPVLAEVRADLPELAAAAPGARRLAASACCPTPAGTTRPWPRVHAAPPADEPSPDDLYILYTGGTTGMPKGVLWRQADIYPAALGGRQLATGEEWPDLAAIVENARNGGTRVLPAAPFMHGAAHWLALNTLGQGNTIVLPGEHHHLRPGRRVGHRRARVGAASCSSSATPSGARCSTSSTAAPTTSRRSCCSSAAAPRSRRR